MKRFTLLLDDVLSATECEALTQRIDALSPSVAPITTRRGPVMAPDIRNNERVIFDDVPLAADLFQRLKASLPSQLEDVDGRPVGLNERFRGYRYREGQRFAPHFDGAFIRNANERSELTVLLYLNEGFLGGATAFSDLDLRVVPKRGQALLFEHYIRHEGCTVDGGLKYVLRSDVMYQRS